MVNKKILHLKTLIYLCDYFQKSKITYGAAIFLKINTIINYIEEVCYIFKRNILIR